MEYNFDDTVAQRDSTQLPAMAGKRTGARMSAIALPNTSNRIMTHPSTVSTR